MPVTNPRRNPDELLTVRDIDIDNLDNGMASVVKVWSPNYVDHYYARIDEHGYFRSLPEGKYFPTEYNVGEYENGSS